MGSEIIPQTGKDKTYWDILNACIDLDITKGHLKWTYSDLSRKSKVTRSLIYYYFGKSKIQILEEACRLFGEILAGTSKEYMEFWQAGDYAAGIKHSKEIFKKLPMLMPYYFINRNSDNTIGELIRGYEKKGIAKRKKFFPNFTLSKARALFALQMGLSTYQGLSIDEVDQALEMLKLE